MVLQLAYFPCPMLQHYDNDTSCTLQTGQGERCLLFQIGGLSYDTDGWVAQMRWTTAGLGSETFSSS